MPTIEKGMRKNEGFFAGLLIIEALDVASLAGRIAQEQAEIAPDLVEQGRRSRNLSRHVRARCPHCGFRLMAEFSLAALDRARARAARVDRGGRRCGYEHVGLRLLPAMPGGLPIA